MKGISKFNVSTFYCEQYQLFFKPFIHLCEYIDSSERTYVILPIVLVTVCRYMHVIYQNVSYSSIYESQQFVQRRTRKVILKCVDQRCVFTIFFKKDNTRFETNTFSACLFVNENFERMVLVLVFINFANQTIIFLRPIRIVIFHVHVDQTYGYFNACSIMNFSILTSGFLSIGNNVTVSKTALKIDKTFKFSCN